MGFALALVFVSVVQCAQYESWTTPLWVIMSAPLALLGTVGALMMRGADMNLYDQIGIVLLVAMASKHAILILEFAKDERERWLSIVEAVLTPAKRRFRPILVTAISSLLGVLPLVAASGARAVSRQAEGAAVFGGMLAAAFFSVVSVPVFLWSCRV